MFWIDPAAPLETWETAAQRPLPPPGTLDQQRIVWVDTADGWAGVNHATGGWCLFGGDERSQLASLQDAIVDPERREDLALLWRRGLVTVGGRSAFDGLSYEAAVEHTREYYTLILLLSGGCNLACSYCYLGHAMPTPANRIELRIAEASIEQAFRQPWDEVLIDFGEIAVASPLFRQLVGHAERVAAAAGKRCRKSIQTNGTSLTPEIVEFLAEHGVSVGMSLDGPAEVHDRARIYRGGRGSYENVVRGLRLCIAAGVPVHLIATVAMHNIDRPREVVAEIASYGVKSYLCKPVLAEGEARDEWDHLGVPADAFAAFMLEVLRFANEHGMEHADQSITKFLHRSLADRKGWRDSCTSRACGSGRSLHVISSAGEVHACPRFVHPGQGLDAGRALFDRPDSILPDLLRPSLREAPASCGGCPWLKSCGGGCTLIAQEGFADPIPLPDPHCVSHYALHEALFREVIPAYRAGRHRQAAPFRRAVPRSAALRAG